MRYLAAAAVLLGGCSSINETHHYASFGPDGTTPINFYRLKVEGSTQFSASRFLSGYYDERAVDMFFNELKVPANSRLFADDAKIPSTDTKLQPLSPDAANGAYVVILSSNADSVANTIGAFAESEIVAEAITNLVSADDVRAKRESDAGLAVAKQRGDALYAYLSAQLQNAAAATTGADARDRYLRTLNEIAAELGATAPFKTFDEARTWFALESGARK